MKLVKKSGPFIESNQSTGKIIRNILLALMPVFIYSGIKQGFFYLIITILVGMISSFTIEFLYQIIILKRRKKEDIIFDFKYNYSFLPGLLVSLILPYGTTIPVIIIASLCASIIGKLLFGGFGNNTFNIPIIGLLITIIIFGGTYKSLPLDTKYNNDDFLIKNIEMTREENTIPYKLDRLVLGDITGSPAEVTSLVCIVSLIFLIITKSIKWRISIIYISVVFFLSTLYGLFYYNELTFGLVQILSGGLLFYSVFIANNSVTTPVTNIGQIILGMGLGVLTCLFRFITPYYYESIIFSIIIFNILTKYLDNVGFNYKKEKTKLMLPLLIILLISISIFII